MSTEIHKCTKRTSPFISFHLISLFSLLYGPHTCTRPPYKLLTSLFNPLLRSLETPCVDTYKTSNYAKQYRREHGLTIPFTRCRIQINFICFLAYCPSLYTRGLKLAARRPFAAPRAKFCGPHVKRKYITCMALRSSGPRKGLSASFCPCALPGIG